MSDGATRGAGKARNGTMALPGKERGGPGFWGVEIGSISSALLRVQYTLHLESVSMRGHDGKPRALCADNVYGAPLAAFLACSFVCRLGHVLCGGPCHKEVEQDTCSCARWSPCLYIPVVRSAHKPAALILSNTQHPPHFLVERFAAKES